MIILSKINGKLKICAVMVFCFITIIIIYCIIKFRHLPTHNYYKIVNNYKNYGNVKTILLWTKYEHRNDWYFNKNVILPKDFEDNNCKRTDCIITTESSYLERMYMFDALMFHAAEDIYPSHYFNVTERSSNQIYVFFSLESPAHSVHKLAHDYNLYNWTMTYRSDSDVHIPYGSFKEIDSKAFIDAKDPIWQNINLTFYDEHFYQQTMNKTKKIAWFVTNCNALSGRDNLVKSIQQYISVDIYGKCGKLSCKRFSKDCDLMLERDYKFYLSFENSLCVDYVTEKLYKIMQYNIIPVVFGGVDYKKIAPPHSYIDVNDFATTKDLADYLNYLDENPNEYIKYFWWKSHYKSFTHSIWYGFCKLCEKLHDQKLYEKYQYYKNIEEWWYGNACNIKSEIIF